MFRLFLILITFFAISLFSKEFKDDGYYRYVQVLAIRDFSRAQIVMKKLEEHGYEYIVRDSIKKGEQYFRVVVGPFSKNSIKQEQEKLNKLLYLKSSFILTYETKPSDTVQYKKIISSKKVETKPYIEEKEDKERIDKIVQLSFTRESFVKNKNFVCKELNELVSKNYPPAILLLASNYIKGDECVKQDLSKAIKYLKNMQKEGLNLPKNLVKFSKELLAETYIKTSDRDNFLKAKKLFDELLLDETNSDKYTIYLYKRLAYIEYTLKEYKYMNLWLLEAAKLDDIESQINLSKNYISGTGVEKNIEKAVYWLEKCVDKDKKCGENLGAIYMNINYKIAPNLDKAFISYAKAVKLGSQKAKSFIDNRDEIEEFYSFMQSDEIQYKLVVEYLNKYIKKEELKNIFITNINQRDKEYDVFISLAHNNEEKVAKLVFLKNRHNYWFVKDFKIANSILTLR